MKRCVSVRYTALSDVARQPQWISIQEVPALLAGQYRCLDLDTDALSDRMCPVQLLNEDCVILVLSEYLQDDGVLALRIAMQQAGLKLANNGLVVVSASQLSAVTRRNRVSQRPPDKVIAGGKTAGHVLFCLLDDMIAWALRHTASDLHLGVFWGHEYAQVAFSVRGVLVHPEQFRSISCEVMHELLAVAWMRVQGGSGPVFEPDTEQQGRLDRVVSGKQMTLRWTSIASHKGPAVTLRLLQRDANAATASLDRLGYSESQLQSLYRARLSTGGAVLMAGAVGSGKSTTLAALIRSLPAERKVITLEDPIEFELSNAIQCAVTKFGDGDDDRERFDLKLRAIKRSAANDVLIGEIRDAGSARALSDLLISGTNVYSTIHAGCALQIIHRLCSPMLGVAPDLLAVPGVLKLLAYQVLLNRLCSCCLTTTQWLESNQRYCALGLAQSAAGARAWLSEVERTFELSAQDLRFRNHLGCEQCKALGQHTYGYNGYLLASEMIEPVRMAGFDCWIARMSGHAGSTVHQPLEIPYERASHVAKRYLSQGWLDPREFILRFGDV